MDRTEEIFSSSGSLANSYLADALRGAGASLEEFVTANASFAVIVFVALFFVLVIVALILHGVAPTRIGEKKDTDGVTEKNDESESPHGTLECFGVTGSVLKTIRVFAYEPDWDYDQVIAMAVPIFLRGVMTEAAGTSRDTQRARKIPVE